MNQTCGTCRHWGDAADQGEQFRVCQAVIHDEDDQTSDSNSIYQVHINPTNRKSWQQWIKPEHIQELLDFREANKAVVQDKEWFNAILKCRADFGCVLHELSPQAVIETMRRWSASPNKFSEEFLSGGPIRDTIIGSKLVLIGRDERGWTVRFTEAGHQYIRESQPT